MMDDRTWLRNEVDRRGKEAVAKQLGIPVRELEEFLAGRSNRHAAKVRDLRRRLEARTAPLDNQSPEEESSKDDGPEFG